MGSIHFLLDDWLGEGALMDLCPFEILVDALRTTLAEYGALQHNWNNIPIVGQLPLDILNKLQLVHPAPLGKKEDRLRWNLESNGLSSFLSTYQLLLQVLASNQQAWKQIWKFAGPCIFFYVFVSGAPS